MDPNHLVSSVETSGPLRRSASGKSAAAIENNGHTPPAPQATGDASSHKLTTPDSSTIDFYSNPATDVEGVRTPQLTLSQHSSTTKNKWYTKYQLVSNSDENGFTSELHPEHKTHIFGWWKYELLASVISIGAIMALALVVRRFEGVPLQEVTLPSSVQLSAIVAALSTIMRVSMMLPVASAINQDAWLWMSSARHNNHCYSRLKDLDVTDNASRGPWGSLLFLFKARRRYYGYMGALITILSLGVGTFTQQIVAYEVMPLNKGLVTLPNISRSQTWSLTQGYQDVSQEYLQPAMKSAIYNGLFVPNVAMPALSCPTGNCTWPITPSLAVCGDCTRSSFVRTCASNATQHQCKYTVPSGNSWMNATNLVFSAKPGTGSIYNASDPKRRYLANFDVGGMNVKNMPVPIWNLTNFVSYECALWACVKSYSAEVQGSAQIQTPNQSWSDITGVYENPQNLRDLNATFGNPTTTNTSLTAGKDEYVVAELAVLAVQNFMKDNGFFAGNVSRRGTGSGTKYYDAYIEVMFNATLSGTLNLLVQNLAISMSNVFRTAEPAHNPAYNGVASTLSVVVKWKWLSFPIILVAASLALSVVNIVRTARSEVGAWKGGPLALLVCDMDVDVRELAVGSMGIPGGLVRSVGERKVVLVKDGRGGWGFAVPNLR